MTYLVPADFRTGTVQSWTLGLTLTESQVSNAALTDIIAAASVGVDQFTDDHFEPQTGVTLDLYVPWYDRLFLPRIRAITSVATRQADDSFLTVAASKYQIVASALGATVADQVQIEGRDYLELRGWGTAYSTTVVRVIGNFAWPVTPVEIKRATALVVWDWARQKSDQLQRSDHWETAGSVFDVTAPNPTRVPEANDILHRYQRALAIVG